jgi:hypothetical protein
MLHRRTTADEKVEVSPHIGTFSEYSASQFCTDNNIGKSEPLPHPNGRDKSGPYLMGNELPYIM